MTLTKIPEVPLIPNPTYPSGYNNDVFEQTFDFTRNWFYQPIGDSTNGGIAITDLTTMHVIQTVTLAQMFAGTSYGPTPGVPYSQGIYDVACGNGTDLYLLNGPDQFHRHLIRVDPDTMTVTGDFYGPGVPGVGGVAGNRGVCNTTATHTIVAFATFTASGGPLIYDGSGMAFIDFGPAPLYGNNGNVALIPGLMHDGDCDFLLLNSDFNHPSGNVDIWRITIADDLTITSVKTGSANILAIFDPSPNLFIAQADYDIAHDAIILQLTNSSTPAGPPIYVLSVNFDGTINWSNGPIDTIGSIFSKGQSQLTGNTIVVGGGADLTMLDTRTGEITFTGSVTGVSGSYYRVYDGTRAAYWTYGLATTGFTKIIGFPVRTLKLVALYPISLGGG